MNEQLISTGLFQGLGPILANRVVMMTISTNDGNGTLTVNIIPTKVKDDDNEALTTPLSVTGTAEELDRDLARQVREFAEVHATSSSNLAQIKKDLEAAEKAAREEANKKKAAKAKVVAPAPEQNPDPPKPPEPPMMSLFDSTAAEPRAAANAGNNQ